jgi:hypothetical protein
MVRTQIQLPDWLIEAARGVAARKEISLAELVRRGLEYMVAVTPEDESAGDGWELPVAHPLGGRDVFGDDGWREALHTERLMVAEEREDYGTGGGS